MQMISADILDQYAAVLKKRAVPVSHHADYRKWLRYYLDFRRKYPLPDSKSEHVRLFVEKLREKNQTSKQQEQTAHASSLYFESLQKAGDPAPRHPVTQKHVAPFVTGSGNGAPFTPSTRVNCYAFFSLFFQ